MNDKYTWQNPEAHEWLRPHVEEMLLMHPPLSVLVVTCKKCGHNTAHQNQKPFGIDQIVSFMIGEFKAMEAKGALEYIFGLIKDDFAKAALSNDAEARP